MLDKLISILGDLCKEPAPGKKKVQKILYLAERNGLDLGLDYSIHFYGPYSTDLEHWLHVLESKNIISIDTSGMTHKIKMVEEITDNHLSSEENEIWKGVITKYMSKTPLDLELLTTTDYVANSVLDEKERNPEAIINLVRKIKGEKFSTPKIADSIEMLQKDGLLE